MPMNVTPPPSKAEFWRTVFAQQQPVVWRGAAADQPLVELARRGPRALMQALGERAGSRRVQVTGAPPSAAGRMGFDGTCWRDWSTRQTSFSGFGDDLLQELAHPSGHCLYMQSAEVAEHLPELEPLTSLWLRDAEAMRDAQTQLWIGSGGQRVAIHQDYSHSVAVMAAGVKEFTLYPPQQLCNLYTAPRDELGGEPWRSAVDGRAPDLARFPRFAAAQRTAKTIRLEAGDVLFLPAYWWHSVDSYEFNAMFNVRWFDVSEAQRVDATAAMAHGLIAARAADAGQRQDLAEALRREVFARTTPVDDGQRDAWLQTLSRVAHAKRAAVDVQRQTPLRLCPQASMTLEAGAVSLRGAASTRSVELQWAFVPMLAAFESPTSADDALVRLSAEFDIEPAEFFGHVDALLEARVLKADRGEPSGLSEDAVAAAVAHVGLNAAELPRCHRTAIDAVLNTFGFLRAGTPYEHLPADDRGMLADPMPDAAAASLRAMVGANIALRYGTRLLAGDRWTQRYVIARGRTLQLASGGATLHDHAAATPRPVAWEHLELLESFRQAATPADVFTDVAEQWATSRRAFERLIDGWIAMGLLVADRGLHAAPSRGVALRPVG